MLPHARYGVVHTLVQMRAGPEHLSCAEQMHEAGGLDDTRRVHTYIDYAAVGSVPLL